MDSTEKSDAISNFIGESGDSLELKGNLNQLLYSMSELGFFDDLSVDDDLAILIWKAVEAARTKKVPTDLFM